MLLTERLVLRRDLRRLGGHALDRQGAGPRAALAFGFGQVGLDRIVSIHQMG
jgi:hypothetical protein